MSEMAGIEAARIETVVGADVAPLARDLATADAMTRSAADKMRARQMAAARSVGMGLTRGVTLPLLAIGAAAVKSQVDFNKNMTLLQTSAGASAAAVQQLKGKVLDLAKASPYGPDELAQALYHLKSLGYDNARSMMALKVGIKGAEVGGADLESTVNALGAAMRTFKLPASATTSTMAQLAAIAGVGNMRMSDLIAAMGTGALPVFKNAGLTIRDFGAALATMTDEGVPANAAATRLRMTISLMAAPSKRAQKALASIGLGSLSLAHAMEHAQGPSGKLAAALSVLKEHLDQVRDPAKRLQLLTEMFGGGRSSSAIQMLVNNLGMMEQKYQKAGPTVSQFNQRVLAAQNTELNRLKEAWSNVQVALVKFGGAIVPAVAGLAGWVAKIAGWFSALPASVQSFIAKFALLAAAVGPVMVGFLKIQKALVDIRVLFGLEAAASREATATVKTDMAEQATAMEVGPLAKLGAMRTALIGLASKAFVVTMILSIIPHSSGGQNALDAIGLGALGHLPVLGGLFSQAGDFGNWLRKKLGRGSVYSSGGHHHQGPPKPPPGYLASTYGMGASTRANPAGYLTPAQLRQQYGYDPHSYGRGPSTAVNPKGFLKIGSKADREFEAKRHRFMRNHLHRAVGYHPSATGAGSGGFQLPQSIQTQMARADALAATHPNANGPTQLQIKAAEAAKAAAMRAIQAHGAAWKGAQAAWGVVQQANSVLYQRAKQVAQAVQTFSLPMKLQLAQARADALAALNPNLQGPSALQIKLAKQTKAAAMRAIDSHKLSMQALIQAWQVVQQANGVLAQAVSGQANTYSHVSTRALIQGLHLSKQQAMAIRERAAQRDAHGGNRPTGPASNGVVIEPHHHHHHHARQSGGRGDIYVENLHLHGVHDTDKLYAELHKRPARRHQQRAGQR